MKFLTYILNTGKITSMTEGQEELKIGYISDLIGVLDCPDYDTTVGLHYYILDNIITLKPTQSTTLDKLTLTADGIDIITITDAPTGIFTATNSETITGEISGSDTFATTIAGTYKITITSFPYLDFTATIEAT